MAAPSTKTSTFTPTITRTLTPSSTPTVVDVPTPTYVEPTTEEVPVVAEPVEGQKCEVEQIGQYSSDGTLVCSGLEGAWVDTTHSSREAVTAESPCSEPGARAQIFATEAIATCSPGPDGNLIWNWPS